VSPSLTYSLVFLAACTTSAPLDPARTGTWTLAWSDEFDGPADSPIDETVWNFDVGNGSDGWGNLQLEYDTPYTTNVSHDGQGHLQIIARKESYGGFSYTSGRIHTRDKVSLGYGRYEARLKMPFGTGLWPAFWLLGADFGSVGWPNCGEVDIMELNGAYPLQLHGTVHGPGYSGGSGVGTTHNTNTPLTTDFHTYAVEIQPQRIAFWFDDIQYQILTSEDLPSGTEWVFDGEFFVLLNLAVGGHYVGDPDFTTDFPATYLIDYVRFMELEE
jgi:beta-glucanase (GH16 family)